MKRKEIKQDFCFIASLLVVACLMANAYAVSLRISSFKAKTKEEKRTQRKKENEKYNKNNKITVLLCFNFDLCVPTFRLSFFSFLSRSFFNSFILFCSFYNLVIYEFINEPNYVGISF